VVEPAGLEL